MAENEGDNDVGEDDRGNTRRNREALPGVQGRRRGMSRMDDVRIEGVCGRFLDENFYSKLGG